MNTSVAWLNDYLDPAASAQEQGDILTHAGFPMEHREEIKLPGGAIDVRQDIELTSNRGDCLCHVGLAREIAAVCGRRLKLPNPTPKAGGPPAASIVKVSNREPALCPLYTARVIRGVRVGPSPKWMADRLIARGDIPRNNIVDASNFVLFELGQPTHVFDLAKLSDSPHQIIIRKAKSGEPLLPIGEGATEIKLNEEHLVIADANRAVAIAGVKGGALTAVSSATTDVLLEAATFAPVTVRSTSRRLGIASDSSYRFERGVHPGQIEGAANRLAELILQMCGGTLCQGVVSDGLPIPPRRQVAMRCERCRGILGQPARDEQMVELLGRLGFEPILQAGTIRCSVPHPRLDIEQEIDLIEEVGRMLGHDAIPVADTIRIRVAAPQPHELAKRAVGDALAGMGYVETVTHSLISEQAASMFLPPGMQTLRVADERAKAEPALRPSLLPSLLRVLALNRNNGVEDVKLFETATVFARAGDSHIERTNLALLQPADTPEQGLREIRGAVDRLVQIVLGSNTQIHADPDRRLPWLAPGAVLKINGSVLGMVGVLEPAVTKLFGLDEPLYAGEIGLPAHFDRYPPETEAAALPSFPAIERDVSAIVDDRLPWADVKRAVLTLALEHLEVLEFVTTFRGKQTGAGRKSLTLRLRFRAPDRTLKHDEVKGQMDAVIALLQSKFAAEIRK